MDNEHIAQNSMNDILDQEESGGSFMTVLRFLRRFIVLITIMTIIGTGLGLVYAYKKDETVYTQTKAVIFIASIDNPVNKTATMATNISLTKKYLSTVQEMVVQPIFTSKARDIYHNKYNSWTYFSSGNIKIKETNGMILSVSCTDGDATVAAQKLDVFIEAVQEVFASGDAKITADAVNIEAIDNVPTTTSSNGFTRFVLVGVLGGLVGGVLIALLFYLLDNTVASRSDLERLTGATVVAYIDDIAQ